MFLEAYPENRLLEIVDITRVDMGGVEDGSLQEDLLEDTDPDLVNFEADQNDIVNQLKRLDAQNL